MKNLILIFVVLILSITSVTAQNWAIMEYSNSFEKYVRSVEKMKPFGERERYPCYVIIDKLYLRINKNSRPIPYLNTVTIKFLSTKKLLTNIKLIKNCFLPFEYSKQIVNYLSDNSGIIVINIFDENMNLIDSITLTSTGFNEVFDRVRIKK